MNTTPPEYLRELGPSLVANGYAIIPIKRGHKHPAGVKGWHTLQMKNSDVTMYAQQGYQGVGVLCERTPAIDIDVRDPEVVEMLLAWLAKRIGPGQLIQRTGNAPKTLLVFQVDAPISKMLGPTYEDWDGTKHTIEILGKGQQFVAFAEHPDTKQPYIWPNTDLTEIKSDKLPVLTQELIAGLLEYFEELAEDPERGWVRVGAGTPTPTTQVAPTTALENARPAVDIDTSRLVSALKGVDATEHDTWVKVGMALYHQFDGSDNGKSLWNDWSSKADNYDSDTIDKRWKTFEKNLREGPPLTAAYILKLAKGNASEAVPESDRVGAFIGRYLYVAGGDRVCDLQKPPHHCMFRLSEFKNLTANVRHEVPAPIASAPERTKVQAVHLSWLVHPDRKHAEGTRYAPGKGRVLQDTHKLDWINTFYLETYPETQEEDKLKVVFDHFDYMFPVAEEREWFIDWVAFNLQKPERRCKVTPLHISVEHGTGRGWIVELMQTLLGHWNCTKTKMKTLSGDGGAGAFNDFLNDSLFCAVEEVREGRKRFEISDRIRDILTEDTLEINVKYGGKQTQPVYTNFFFMSNHPDAMVLSELDRRVMVLSGPKKPKSNRYYEKLYGFLEREDAVAQFYHWVLRRDLKKFNWQRAPMTPAKQAMIEYNYTDTERYFKAMLEDLPAYIMGKNQVVRAVTALSGGPFKANIDAAQIKKLMQHYATRMEGEDRKKQYRPTGGSLCTPWLFDGSVDRNERVTNEDINAALNEAEKTICEMEVANASESK